MITQITTSDKRFPLGPGAGSDAIHRDPVYSYAVTLLKDDNGHTGTGLAFTLGEGNDLVCKAAAFLAQSLKGRDIEELMADFGTGSEASPMSNSSAGSGHTRVWCNSRWRQSPMPAGISGQKNAACRCGSCC